MYKLIKEYENKNKIIQQIQKNLSRPIPKEHTSTHKKETASPSPTHINFPSLNMSSEYSARSNHKSLETKLSSQFFKSEKATKNKVEVTKTTNWIKSISLKNREISEESFLITNITKNLINSLEEYADKSLKEGPSTMPKTYDFETNSKVVSEYESLKKRQYFQDHPPQWENAYQSEWMKEQRKVKRRAKAEKKRPESNIENIKSPVLQNEKETIRYYEAPLILNKKGKAKSIRVCSPWQLSRESKEEDEVLDFLI